MGQYNHVTGSLRYQLLHAQESRSAGQAGALPSAASNSFLHSQEPFAAHPPDRAPSLPNGSAASIASEQTEGDDLVDIPLQVCNDPTRMTPRPLSSCYPVQEGRGTQEIQRVAYAGSFVSCHSYSTGAGAMPVISASKQHLMLRHVHKAGMTG